MALYPLVRPLAFALDAETAHRATIRALKLAPAGRTAKADPVLAVNVAGLDFPNPVGLAAGLRDVTFARPYLPHRGTVRDLARFASRMQLSALTGFVNSELDILVIAAFLPVKYAGLYALGLQAAAAARTLPLFVFAPVLTRLAATFRRSGRSQR